MQKATRAKRAIPFTLLARSGFARKAEPGVCISVLRTVRRLPFPDLAAILILSNSSSVDRLGALERLAGEAAVDIGAQRRPRRNKLKNIDAEMNV